MLRFHGLLAALLVATLPLSAGAAASWPPDDAPAVPPTGGQTVERFRQALEPHGRWTRAAGRAVWIPDAGAVGPAWKPFTRGHWELTEYGWTWVSDFSWGWAPFHHGSWIRHPGPVGWAWVPGTVWSPAAVSFRWGGGLVGWGPAASKDPSLADFTFVSTADLGAARPADRAIGAADLARAGRLARHSSLPRPLPGKRVAISAGPSPEELATLAGKEVFVPHGRASALAALRPPAASPPTVEVLDPGRPRRVVRVLRGVGRRGRPLYRRVVIRGSAPVLRAEPPPPTPLVIEVGAPPAPAGQPRVDDPAPTP